MKINFPSVDLDVSLSEIEYKYLQFICHQTLQTSDEVLRSQLRQLQLPGVPDFHAWRLEQGQVLPLALPEATTTVDVQPISPESNGGTSHPVEQDQPELSPQPTKKSRARRSQPVKEDQAELSPQPTKKSRARRSQPAQSFEAGKLLADFRGHSIQNAVQIVLAQEPDRSFGTDELIGQIYGEFTETELTKARRSLGKILSNGAKDGLWQRVQEKPPLYQLLDEADADSASTSAAGVEAED